ncbi:uncharacterized protein Gbp1 [Drosophila pseudoobscura]|uniref:Uncharacterized protein Gbp1 n=1 Tax=Drosophila pseudoobscura pseudoobscura TaxID=46245 RepID=A0A6I8V4T4_DROPS|nr:uncharacterized protein LOC6898911 [Drosophila pseudoobscura]
MMKTANRSPQWLWCLLPLVVLWACTEARTRPCINDSIVFPRDNDDSGAAKVPAWIVTTAKPPTASTPTPNDSTEQTTDRSEDSLNDTATTIIPIIVNRILVETLPRCKSGFELRANRCRKSA